MEKVLIVGEALAGDEATRKLLAREGYELAVAGTRAEALQLLQQETPLCVLLDHQLAGDDGLQAMRALLRAEGGCEVILVTDGGQMDAAVEALRAGVLDYLRKPIDPEQLLVALGRARERRPKRKALASATLLVVEDDEPTRRRMAMVLAKEGYRVEAAPDGAAALAVFQQKRIDLIIADLRMPTMNGLELLDRTKGQGADVEFIMITGYGQEDDVVRALRAGAANFLSKPIDLEQMLLAVQKALDFQTTRRSLTYRTRDLELMQQLVVRLTARLELIVEAPEVMPPEVRDFLVQLVDSLSIGLAVVGSDGKVLFANRHVAELAGEKPGNLAIDWLARMGIQNLTEERLESAFRSVVDASPGTIETLVLSRWSFLVMTPLSRRRQDGTEVYVAMVIRGERRQQAS